MRFSSLSLSLSSRWSFLASRTFSIIIIIIIVIELKCLEIQQTEFSFVVCIEMQIYLGRYTAI